MAKQTAARQGIGIATLSRAGALQRHASQRQGTLTARKAAAERSTARASAETCVAAQGQSPARRSCAKRRQSAAVPCIGKARKGRAMAKRRSARQGQGPARHWHSSGVRFVARALVCADTLGVGKALHSTAMGKAEQRMAVATLRAHGCDARRFGLALTRMGNAWRNTAMASHGFAQRWRSTDPHSEGRAQHGVALAQHSIAPPWPSIDPLWHSKETPSGGQGPLGTRETTSKESTCRK